MTESNTQLVKRPSAGQPSPWVMVPTTPIRLPKKFQEELIAVARLLDSGVVDSADITKIILALAKDGFDRPAPTDIKELIENLTRSIVIANGWDLTATEVGLIVHTLEQSAKEVDKVFASKAKAEAIASPNRRTRKK